MKLFIAVSILISMSTQSSAKDFVPWPKAKLESEELGYYENQVLFLESVVNSCDELSKARVQATKLKNDFNDLVEASHVIDIDEVDFSTDSPDRHEQYSERIQTLDESLEQLHQLKNVCNQSLVYLKKCNSSFDILVEKSVDKVEIWDYKNGGKHNVSKLSAFKAVVVPELFMELQSEVAEICELAHDLKGKGFSGSNCPTQFIKKCGMLPKLCDQLLRVVTRRPPVNIPDGYTASTAKFELKLNSPLLPEIEYDAFGNRIAYKVPITLVPGLLGGTAKFSVGNAEAVKPRTFRYLEIVHLPSQHRQYFCVRNRPIEFQYLKDNYGFSLHEKTDRIVMCVHSVPIEEIE